MALSKKIRTNVARNLRRQIDRRIARAEQIKSEARSQFIEQSYERKIAQLKESKKATYITAINDEGKRVTRSDAEITRGLQKASQELSQSRYITQRGHRNLASTQSQLNAASTGAVSEYTKEEVKIFYRATQKAWQRPGVSVQDRNQAILEYYGYENLSELVSDVLTLNQQAVDKAKQLNAEDLTSEQSEATSDNDVREAQQSPTYLQDVIEMPDSSGLEELEKSE